MHHPQVHKKWLELPLRQLSRVAWYSQALARHICSTLFGSSAVGCNFGPTKTCFRKMDCTRNFGWLKHIWEDHPQREIFFFWMGTTVPPINQILSRWYQVWNELLLWVSSRHARYGGCKPWMTPLRAPTEVFGGSSTQCNDQQTMRPWKMTMTIYDLRYLGFPMPWSLVEYPSAAQFALALPRPAGCHSGSPVGGLCFRMGHLECWLMCSRLAGGHSCAGGMVGRNTWARRVPSGHLWTNERDQIARRTYHLSSRLCQFKTPNPWMTSTDTILPWQVIMGTLYVFSMKAVTATQLTPWALGLEWDVVSIEEIVLVWL